MPHAAGTRPPYTELLFGRIRDIHDRVYFGRWRREDATENDLQVTKRQLAEFVDLLVREAGSNPPSTSAITWTRPSVRFETRRHSRDRSSSWG